MQLHYLLLLVAVVAFYGVDASASTKSKSIQVITGAIGEKDGPTTRILRSYDSEERINLTAWVNPLVPNVVSYDIHFLVCRKLRHCSGCNTNVVSYDIHFLVCRKLRHCSGCNRKWLGPYFNQVDFKK
ncbi:RxLR effector protein [Phytophthora megakarya]|uniref:RxLR effector protein n=1 Tax=Phytophthora megakarya TaxID=4795 RepID=A0A225VGI5_9STRA|nr:RxLR effector protein [Phytophthora megakarya]